MSRTALYVISALALRIVAASYNATMSICSSLSDALPMSIFLPDTTTYNNSISSYPFPQLRLHPTCVVRPKTPEDVGVALHVLRHNKHNKFAVKGGGHNVNVGFANVEDGVTIDMQSLNKVEVDMNSSVVRIGAGALWQNVYDETDKYNVTVMGGRIGVVGVAGFLTGGGISFFSPERGWACDYIVNMQVLLANSTLINANATSNPSLFAALKGGQNNFGIVTRCDLKSFPGNRLWGGRIIHAPGSEKALLDAYTNFKLGPYDPYAAGWVTIDYSSVTEKFTPISILWYTKPKAQPGALGQITNIRPQAMNGMAYGSVAEFARNASVPVKAAPKHTIWATTTFHITPTILFNLHLLWKSLVPPILSAHAYAHPSSQLTFQAIMPPPPASSPQNSLGFAPGSTPHKDLVFLQLIFVFDDQRALAPLEAALAEVVAKFEEAARGESAAHGWKYLNFAARFQDPLGSYGEREKGRMRGVARRYDPLGVFQKQVEGFKLF